MSKSFFPLVFVISALLFLSGCDEGESYWPRTAGLDIRFIHAQLLDNHPGAINAQDPEFARHLEAAYRSALVSIPRVSNRADYDRTIAAFLDGVRESRVRVVRSGQKKKVSPEKKDGENIGFDEIAPKVAWIRIPRFAVEGEKQKEQMADMVKLLPHLRPYRAIIFDLHGNAGADSAWGHWMLDALFSPLFSQQQYYELWQRVSIEYRVSKENVAYLKQLSRRYGNKFGADDEIAKGYKSLYNIMKEAFERGEKFVAVPKGQYTPVMAQVVDPVHAPIIVIIDEKTGGAALEFIDEIKNYGHQTILFGRPTAVDSGYLDTRSVKLPSALGTLNFPMKVLRGRRRTYNEGYRPDVRYDGDLDDVRSVATTIYRIVQQFKMTNEHEPRRAG
ncbi:MAG: S41 family peptidase [Candidatus Dependentiae bacterium]|nr:S41 family peptidase [Candidatus Dependentiae bacterium]